MPTQSLENQISARALIRSITVRAWALIRSITICSFFFTQKSDRFRAYNCLISNILETPPSLKMNCANGGGTVVTSAPVTGGPQPTDGPQPSGGPQTSKPPSGMDL